MPLTSKNCCIKVSNSDQIFISSKANCGVEEAFEKGSHYDVSSKYWDMPKYWR